MELFDAKDEAASLIERLQRESVDLTTANGTERLKRQQAEAQSIEDSKNRASLRTEVERLQEQAERTKELRYLGSNLAATVVLGVPTDGSVNVGWIDPYAWWDEVREKIKKYIKAELALDAGTTPAGDTLTLPDPKGYRRGHKNTCSVWDAPPSECDCGKPAGTTPAGEDAGSGLHRPEGDGALGDDGADLTEQGGAE